MFKQKISEVTIEYEGETETIYVRRASGRDMLKALEMNQNNATPLQRAEATLKLLVTKEGKPIKDSEIQEILDMPWDAVTQFTDAITEHAGINKAIAEKADTSKNA